MDTATARPTTRLEGLDIFRGATVAAMIIVNTPGSDHIWWPLDHAEWHGFTPTDLVFPAFLCAMGVALGLSFPRKIDASIWKRVAWRTFALIAIGWVWQLLVRPDLANLRFFGVLPRLGLCYGLTATIAILTARREADGTAHLRWQAIAGAAAAALLFYWAAMALGGDFTPEGNLAGWVDRTLVGTQHIWRHGKDAAGNVVYDPEGLFSTIPALANVLLGILAALAWKRLGDRSGVWIARVGLLLIVAGLALAPWFPLNKKLWTSSFALFTSGASAVLFALCMLLCRSEAMLRLLAPFRVFGMNAILGYILSLLIGLAGMRLGFVGPAFAHIQAVVGDPYLASFLYALAVTLIVLAMLIPLHRRGIHLRL